MCYDHKLELLWESIPVDEVPDGFYHEEVCAEEKRWVGR